jgi:hypothetical protein
MELLFNLYAPLLHSKPGESGRIKSANSSLQIPRTSGLDAPIMELTGGILFFQFQLIHALMRALTGHSGEAFTARFDPTAQHIASGSMDRSIRMSCL